MSATARISHSFTYETTTGSVSDVQTSSSPSESAVIGLLGRKTGEPTGDAVVQNVFNDETWIKSKYQGSIPLHPGFDIDVTTNFGISNNEEKGELNIQFYQKGDNFPTAEILIFDTSKQGLLLGTAHALGTYPERWVGGDNKRYMTSGSLTISYNENGVFTGVTSNGKSYSVTEWNDLMRSKPVVDENR